MARLSLSFALASLLVTLPGCKEDSGDAAASDDPSTEEATPPPEAESPEVVELQIVAPVTAKQLGHFYTASPPVEVAESDLYLISDASVAYDGETLLRGRSALASHTGSLRVFAQTSEEGINFAELRSSCVRLTTIAGADAIAQQPAFNPDAVAREAGILGVMEQQSGHFLASPYGGAFAVVRRRRRPLSAGLRSALRRASLECAPSS